MVLNTFVLIGVVLSFDEVRTTVEFNMNPAVNGGPAIAVIPNNAIPCEVVIGKKIYVVKYENKESAEISCEVEK
ncbi:MAG: hypothetical protein CBB97_00370 [Candidatus Endolissoclinum sp. TMED37]|nr:MAG: hypothetical protein CBB97_00370 [Candidatus Endolissoclinum sp. TMED37]|tara:strand:+ start:57 stop:278 length:222 start_codon:yes stop_codon:yes gene_type:complete